MSEGLNKILLEVSAFYDSIERCRVSTTFNAADYQDAYNRLNRVTERYVHEKENGRLEAHEDQALEDVLERDPFIKGMRHARIIGEHVQKTRGETPVILLTTNTCPIPLLAETSAGSFFSGPTAIARDVQGKMYFVNHLAQLREAEKRLRQAVARATNNLP